jgi:pyruvate dehydrogenase E2 component (dihydrolipoyllysine-residue acetyltransferase)
MTIHVIMPNLGAVSETSTLIQWHVEPGSLVKEGQLLFEAESDKATVEVQANAEGIVGELIAKPGDEIAAGTVIAILRAPGEVEQEPAEHSPELVLRETATSPLPVGIQQNRPRIIATPVARNLAREAGIDLTSMNGSGPEGRIVEADVRALIQARSASHPAEQPGGKTRDMIARRMLEGSQTTAPVTITTEVDAGALIAARRELQSRAVEQKDTIRYDLLLSILAARALKEHPSLNASLTPTGKVEHTAMHIGIAVDTPRGLLVPVLWNVNQKKLNELAADLDRQIRRALEGSITPAEMTGSTFTITNLGMYRVDAFTPIINLPECAILGIGRITSRPIVRDGMLAVGQICVLSLTFDHRLVDGVPAARFLQRLAELIERADSEFLRDSPPTEQAVPQEP